MSSALAGLRVIEIASIGPVPFAGLMLADMGARITRVDRPPGAQAPEIVSTGIEYVGRRSIALDLKKPQAAAVLLRILEGYDVLMEGFRPGVMERLGVGPEACLARNPRLIYGRMTGWGQDGPLAAVAGHDLNYVALTGALHSMGWRDRPPTPPLNLVGDYGGGGMMLLVGILGALYERQASGRGQVIDASMVDGAAALMTPIYGLHSKGLWNEQRASNQLDGGAHFYGVYECADGRFVSIASLEPAFYRLLLETCGIDPLEWPAQLDAASWPECRTRLEHLFRTRSRDEWCALMEGRDICFAPVLDMREAPTHPHNVARGTFIEANGMTRPAPAPRFSRTPSSAPGARCEQGEQSREILRDAEFPEDEISRLIEQRVVFTHP